MLNTLSIVIKFNSNYVNVMATKYELWDKKSRKVVFPAIH